MWLCAFLWCSSFDILTKLLLSNVHKEELCMQADRLGQKTRWGRWRESNIWFSTPPSHTYWTRWGSLICPVFTQQPLPTYRTFWAEGVGEFIKWFFPLFFRYVQLFMEAFKHSLSDRMSARRLDLGNSTFTPRPFNEEKTTLPPIHLIHWTLGCQKLILYSGTCSPPPGLDSTFPTLNDNDNIQMKRAYYDHTNYNSQPKSFWFRPI